MSTDKNIVVIGGSAGSLPVVISIIKNLPLSFKTPVVFVLHRQRNVQSELKHILQGFHKKQIIEPDDKDPVESCCIYLAPQNYHLLLEWDNTFSLDYSEVVRYSRPAIDVTFESAAMVYAKGTIAILLSGANNDGTAGIKAVLDNGGIAIVQDPATAEYPVMPLSAINANRNMLTLSPDAISDYLQKL